MMGDELKAGKPKSKFGQFIQTLKESRKSSAGLGIKIKRAIKYKEPEKKK